ncbi:MAG TPA: hypothetical protein VGV35_10515 [Bryobacteraceae bacterium]|nr:hypothetical protein [Bryobacteraceae bacterium]
MSAIRQMLISTIAFAVIPPVCLRGADIAEYVGGTAKTIPANATGTLSANDARELQFNYGQSVYRLPYAQITGTELMQGEGRHILHKIPVPSFGKRKETLAINYKDAAGAKGTLNFQLSTRQAKDTSAAIDAWKTAPQTATASDPNEWWGDRYWKTNRNKSTWETTTAKTPAPAAPASGTK